MSKPKTGIGIPVAHGRKPMYWNRWYRLQNYAKSSLWVVPLVAIVLEQIVFRVVLWLDEWLGWTFLAIDSQGVGAALGTVVTLTLSFLVFTFGSLLVAIQLASGQLTPRIIATALLRDHVVRYTVGLFVFSMLFAVNILIRVETRVYELAAVVAAALGIVSIAVFLYFIDYVAKLLRPVSIVARLSERGIEVIEAVYPDEVPEDPGLPAPPRRDLGPPDRIVLHRGKSEIVLAINVEALAAEAQRLGGIVEFVPQVGDFVAVGEPLFHLYAGAVDIDDGKLRKAAALGPERTLEQDPMFALRILVDIAIKALSPAINDPTTAVLAIDQLHRLLRLLGRRNLRNEEISDADGRLRVVLRTPNWQDFVHLVYFEIRQYGASNVQIARRLRAMTENLIQTLDACRHTALRQQLDLLDRSLQALYVFPVDMGIAWFRE
jgi:uncharacterized membrane protein